MHPQNDDEMEIDLLELFFELLAHWKMIALSAVLAGAIALSASLFLMTPKYQSTSALYVLSKSTSITSLADIQMGSNLANDYIVVATGRPVLEQVIDNLGLTESYGALKSNISVNNPSNSRILEITVTDTDPKRAKEIADETAKVLSAFIAEKMDQDPPTTIQYGYADGNAVSPNKSKNTILGILVGAVAAMAVVVVGYLLNDTIMITEDVERKLGLEVLGTIPLEDDDIEAKSSKKKKKSKKNA